MATQGHIVLTHWVHQETLDLLSNYGPVLANQSRESLAREELQARLAEARAVMVFMPDCVDAAFLAQCPRLKIVAAALKGFDNIDVAACTGRNIWLSIVPDLLTIPTAELAIGLMISLGRNVLAGDRRIRHAAFQGWRPLLYGKGLYGSTVGILGLGAVGSAIARMLTPFGCTTLAYDVRNISRKECTELQVQPTSLGELYKQSDFLVVALPLTDATLHFIDREALSQMQKSCYLINMGRGSCIDEEAVGAALARERLAGYSADVFAFEDWIRPNRPQYIPKRLLSEREHTLFTPHLGSAVDSVRKAIALEAAANIIDVFEGKRPRGAINSLQ
ncbi:MAG: hydroxyacid dehydrogenase [Desulfobulbaceae bacterium]|nr:hydroxyacid dehydrogenase [Desulfobulbaceae bacterium]